MDAARLGPPSPAPPGEHHPRRLIGGDFELHGLPLFGSGGADALTRKIEGTWTASGRAAFGLLLDRARREGASRVHVPSYLCESLITIAKHSGLTLSFYRVDAELKAHPEPLVRSAVLLIHYFGWQNPATEELRRDAGRDYTLIEDASHALLGDWQVPQQAGCYSFFSARKFGPQPLGGWCSGLADSVEPDTPDLAALETLAARSLAARALRGAYLTSPDAPVDIGVESYYMETVRDLERFLDAHPRAGPMPGIAQRVLAGADWPRIAEARRANWLHLNSLLGAHVDGLHAFLPDGVVPLGFVVRVPDRDDLRRRLASRRIFCPIHWKLSADMPSGSFSEARELSQHCLTLPIDQRYGSAEMITLAGAFLELRGRDGR